MSAGRHTRRAQRAERRRARGATWYAAGAVVARSGLALPGGRFTRRNRARSRRGYRDARG